LAPNNVNGNDKLTNATVFLYEDNRQIAVLKREDDYLFVSDESFSAEQGKSYSLRVTADGLNEVRSAPQLIEPATPIDSFKFTTFEYNYMQLVVFFTVHHPANNGYFLKIDDESEDFFYPYSKIENIVTGFNAVEKRLGSINFDFIEAELFVLSPDLSLFLDSQMKYESSKDDPFFDRPYPVFSNINGGYGIFGAYSVYRERIYQEIGD